jgi:ribonuclease BN (tRNA processing enzyme)
VDGETAIDAGALTEALPLAAQRRVRRIVLTHAHFDHIASLPFLAANLYGRTSSALEVIAPEPVIAALRNHVFNQTTWPDFSRYPSPSRPTLRYRVLSEGRPFRAGSVSVTAVPVNHAVPAYGYIISKKGAAVVFSGDTGPTDRLWKAARRTPNLRAIFLECSFSDAEKALALESLHLTPRGVREELPKLPPRVPIFLYHLKPFSVSRIRREVAALGEARLRILESERSFRF